MSDDLLIVGMRNFLLECRRLNVPLSQKKLLHFYHLFDQWLAQKKISLPISCSEGCCHCCYHWVGDVYSFEAECIKSWIETHLPHKIPSIVLRAKKDEELFIHLFEMHHNLEEDVVLGYFYQENRPCPLLGDDGRCCVYPVRPYTCRSFFSVGRQEQCYPQNYFKTEPTAFILTPSGEVDILLEELHDPAILDNASGLRSIIIDLWE